MNSVSACAHHVQCAETDIIIDWAKPTRERKKSVYAVDGISDSE